MAFHWAYSELCCEVKAQADAFDDDNINSIEGELTPDGRSNRAQLISYYREQSARQHRLFVFSIFIFGTQARFLRFDRAGCLVSARFDYKEHPEFLVSFLWGYSHLNKRARGWDVTRSIASPSDTRLYVREVSQFLEGLRPAVMTPSSSEPETPQCPESETPNADSTTAPEQKLFKNIPRRDGTRLFMDSQRFEHTNGNGKGVTKRKAKARASASKGKAKAEAVAKRNSQNRRADDMYPFHTVDVVYKGSTATATLFIHQPFHQSLSPFGRATRVYLAYDKTHNATCILKDYWRPNHPGLDSEADILETLDEKSVHHLPDVLSSGDVMECAESRQRQFTSNDTFFSGANRLEGAIKLQSLVHHYVVEDVLYPATSFANSQELIGVFRDVLQGVLSSFSIYRILDLSG